MAEVFRAGKDYLPVWQKVVAGLGGPQRVPVFQVDEDGLPIAIGGGGTEYTEGAVDASITGPAVMWEDTADTLRAVSAVKPLPVNVVAGGTSGHTDDSPFTPGTTEGSIIMAHADEAAPDSVDEGDAGALRMTLARGLHVNLRDASGTEISPATQGTLASLLTELQLKADLTETQPVSSLQLPAALVGGRLDTNLGAWLGSTAPTVGQKTAASSVPAVLASDQTSAAAPFAVRLSTGAAFYNTVTGGQLPAALVGGRLDINLGAWLGSTAPTVGQKVAASSVPAVLASDVGLPAGTNNIGDVDIVSTPESAVATVANSIDATALSSTTDWTLLVANTLTAYGFKIQNDSDEPLGVRYADSPGSGSAPDDYIGPHSGFVIDLKEKQRMMTVNISVRRHQNTPSQGRVYGTVYG